MIHIIPFNNDQLISVFGEGLSTVIYWHVFRYRIFFIYLFMEVLIQSKAALAMTHVLIGGCAISTIVVAIAYLNNGLILLLRLPILSS